MRIRYFTLLIFSALSSVALFAQENRITVQGKVCDTTSLEKQALLLDEVVVIGIKNAIRFKADRIIVDLKRIDKTGRTLVDVLKLIPTIKVLDNKLSIFGKSSTAVYIDDRPIRMNGQALMDYLTSLPSESISSIEIISSPPSEYEASGNIGIIKLASDNAMKSGWKALLNSGVIKNSYTSVMVSSFCGYYTKKMDIEGVLLGGSNNQLNQNDYTSFFPEAKIRTSNPKKWSNEGLESVLTMNYKANESNRLLLNLQLPIYDRENVKDIDNLTKWYNKTNQSLDSILYSIGTTSKQTYPFAIDAIYKHLFSKQKNISIAFGYINNSVKSDREWLSKAHKNNIAYNPELYYTSGRMRHNILTTKVDMNYTINGFDFTSGYKLSYITTESKNNLHHQGKLLRPFSNFFQYTEVVNALYSSIDKSYDNYLIKIGLRGELTHTKGNSISQHNEHKDHSFHLFPSLYVGYNNSRHRFSIAYSKRIDRPSYSYLDPFKWFISKYDYAVGNPFLKPSITHLLEFHYLYGDRFSGRAYMTKIIDKIGRFVVLKPEDPQKQVQMTDNFLDEFSYGLNLYHKFDYGISGTVLSGDVCFSRLLSKKKDFEDNDGWASSINMNSTIHLNSNFMLNLNIINNFPGVFNYRRTENMFRTDVGLVYKNDKQNIVLKLNVNDVFKTYKSNYYYYSNSVRQEYSNYYDSRSIKLSIAWRLGNWKTQRISKGESSNVEEKERL